VTFETKALGVAGVLTLVFGASTGWAWSRPAGSSSAVPSQRTQSGEDLFQAKGCAACHRGPSSDSLTETGPDLGELWKVAGTRQPGLSAQDYVRQSIANPGSFVVVGFGNNAMPEIAVSAQEIEALAQYLLEEP
jgi:mono/diheme cytochrome c family protein